MHYNKFRGEGMLYSALIRGISEKITVKVLSVSDKFDIRDAVLIDGAQDHFQNDLLYIGYYAQFDRQNPPPHCVLTAPPDNFKPGDYVGDLAVVAEDRLFFLFNLA